MVINGCEEEKLGERKPSQNPWSFGRGFFTVELTGLTIHPGVPAVAAGLCWAKGHLGKGEAKSAAQTKPGWLGAALHSVLSEAPCGPVSSSFSDELHFASLTR